MNVFRVVLVEPHYAGNIGSVARLMANFGLRDLVLVNPLVDHLSSEAKQYAVHAQDILKNARIVGSLREAVEGSAVVVGTTAKTLEKRVRRTPITPRRMAEILAPYWESDEVVSIVFGREPSGLTNEELELSDFIVTIPTSPDYPSLNLSHAVGIILYELYTSSHSLPRRFPVPRRAWGTLRRFLREAIQISRRHDPEEVEKAIMAAYRRGAVTEKEVNAFIGLLSYFVRRCHGPDRQGPEE